MEIIILDGNSLNPGDLSWDGFKQFGNVTVYDRTPADKIVERIGNAEVAITNKTPISDEIMAQCPSLKYIGVLATGYNVVDTKAAQKRSIVVSNIPSYSTKAVAQAVFALLLELTNGVHIHSQSVHAGDWCASPDFCYWKYPISEIAGKTLGIIGFGDIGQNVAKVALSFGLNVIASTRSTEKIDSFNKKYAVLACDENSEPVKCLSQDEVLSNADIISIHCPLTDKTKDLINKDALSKMKKGAILINTSRGPVVNEQAVRDALENGTLGGFACDVISVEPMTKENPLRGAPNCVITPHVAWAAKETRTRLMNIATQNLKAFVDGNPMNVVSGL